jgi:hypothetical protein
MCLCVHVHASAALIALHQVLADEVEAFAQKFPIPGARSIFLRTHIAMNP